MTPDRLAMAERAARAGDPYFRGYLAGLTDKHNVQPPETPGADSCKEDQ